VSRSHWNSNLKWIQISLQIIKRFEKEKDFPNSYLVMGRNPAGNWVRPGQPLLSPPPFLFFARPSPASLRSRSSRVCPDSPAHGYCSGPRKPHHARSALSPVKPSGISVEPSNGPAASSSPNRAHRLRGGVTKPESSFPNQKICRILTNVWFKLRLEIESGSNPCYTWLGSKTPINRLAFVRYSHKIRAKP
jgi:hypothetical protein